MTRSSPPTSHAPETDFSDEGPSKGQRKRDAHAAQALGEKLIALPDAQLSALQLPDALHDAIVAARNIHSRGGGARQRQYIGRLMRDIDPEPIRAALEAHTAHAVRETQRFHRIEAWRARLMQDGAQALAQLQRTYPALDVTALQQPVAAAQAERARQGTPGPASRELFRILRGLLDGISA
jgi:ribosome-associated protein